VIRFSFLMYSVEYIAYSVRVGEWSSKFKWTLSVGCKWRWSHDGAWLCSLHLDAVTRTTLWHCRRLHLLATSITSRYRAKPHPPRL